MTTRAAQEEQGPSRANLARCVSGDLQRQQDLGFDVAAGVFEVELREMRVAGTRAGDEHVVNRRGQLVEEPSESVEVGGVEGRDAGPELKTDSVEAVRVARRDDEVGSFVARAPGRLEPDAGAAADHDKGLSGEFQLVAYDAASASRTGRAWPW